MAPRSSFGAAGVFFVVRREGGAMVKVEAVVVRDKVEEVMDAVTEHRPRRRHRDRGGRARSAAGDHARVPRPRLRVALPPEGAVDLRRRRATSPRRSWRRSSRRHGPGTNQATGSSGRRRSGVRCTTAPAGRSRRWSREQQGPRDRGVDDLGRRRGGARDVHAGRLRVPRGRADADEERRPRRCEERAHVRARRGRLLPRRLRDRVRRRRQRPRRRLRLPAAMRTRCSRSARSRSPGSRRFQRPGRTCSRSSSRASRSRSSGARWPSGRSCGCTSPSASSSS